MNRSKEGSSKMKSRSIVSQNYLLKHSIFRVGVVSSVDGREVTVRVDKDKNLSHLLFQGELLNNVSVGSYVKILKGFNRLIGKIEREYIKEIIVKDDYGNPSEKIDRFLSVKLIGYYKESKYNKGVKELPLIGNECLILEKSEYQHIHNFSSEDEVSIKLGHLASDDSIPIEVSVNKLFASHIGIFGNTGSGKSYTLASLYKLLFDRFGEHSNFQENARFLLFDFNGEYSRQTSITSQKKVYNLSTMTNNGGDKIRLNPEVILTPEIFFILASATEKTQQPFIRRALRLYEKVQIKDDPIGYTRGIIRNQLIQTLTMADLVMGDLLIAYFVKLLSNSSDNDENLLDDIGRQSRHNCFYYKHNTGMKYFNDPNNYSYIEQTKIFQAVNDFDFNQEFITRITKFSYIQLINDVLSNRAKNEHIAPAISKLNSLSKDFSKVISIPANNEHSDLWEDGKPLVVINLDKVNTSTKKLIPLLISHWCYQEHKSHKQETVTKSLNIVIDEAHNILSYDSNRESESWKDFRLETFEEIIKEGRKFGVFLTIASQRPSDISSTIISQLHNYFVHRLINNRDLEMIEKAISYLDKLSIETLPILPPGACVLSGIIADLPVIIQIDKLEDSIAPKSQMIKLTDSWEDKQPTTPSEGERELGQL